MTPWNGRSDIQQNPPLKAVPDLPPQLQILLRTDRHYATHFLSARHMTRVFAQKRALQTSWPIRTTRIALLCFTVSCCAFTARAFTAADADAIFDAHAKAFY